MCFLPLKFVPPTVMSFAQLCDGLCFPSDSNLPCFGDYLHRNHNPEICMCYISITLVARHMSAEFPPPHPSNPQTFLCFFPQPPITQTLYWFPFCQLHKPQIFMCFFFLSPQYKTLYFFPFRQLHNPQKFVHFPSTDINLMELQNLPQPHLILIFCSCSKNPSRRQ